MTAIKSLLNTLVANWALSLSLASAAILGAALFFQFGLGYQPCELCLYQRYPYVLVIVVGILAYLMRHRDDIASRRAARGFLVIMTALLFLDAGIAAHHIGVEQGYWEAYTSCVGNVTGTASIDSLPEISIPCDQRRTFLGISFAEYNFVFALALGAFGAYTMRKTR